MDLKEIKKRLESLQSNGKKSSKDNEERKKKIWKPSIGKQSIRIVPSKFDKKNPFRELYIYYGIGNKKMMISLVNFKEKDPINEFIKKLRESSDKENWSLAKKLEAKMRIFVPVIVRGEENQGVRLWEFGKEIYMEFLSIADDDDIGDFTDIHEGRDITVDTVGPETTGTAYNKSSIRVRTKITPLSSDENEIKKWLNEQPDPLELFTKYSYEDMKSELQKWLTPEEEEQQEETPSNEKKSDNDEEESDLPWEKEEKSIPQAQNKLNAPKKANNKDKFDELFDEE
jgi:hypothetical protein